MGTRTIFFLVTLVIVAPLVVVGIQHLAKTAREQSKSAEDNLGTPGAQQIQEQMRRFNEDQARHTQAQRRGFGQSGGGGGGGGAGSLDFSPVAPH